MNIIRVTHAQSSHWALPLNLRDFLFCAYMPVPKQYLPFLVLYTLYDTHISLLIDAYRLHVCAAAVSCSAVKFLGLKLGT